MPALISSKDIEVILRERLREAGYQLSEERRNGETGTDIVAIRSNECVHIEVIAFKSSPPARSKDFYEAFFRAVSRLENDATHCVIALPARFAVGLPQRCAAIGAAWNRIGAAFPELQIWLVDAERKSIQQMNWSSWIAPSRRLAKMKAEEGRSTHPVSS